VLQLAADKKDAVSRKLHTNKVFVLIASRTCSKKLGSSGSVSAAHRECQRISAAADCSGLCRKQRADCIDSPIFGHLSCIAVRNSLSIAAYSFQTSAEMRLSCSRNGNRATVLRSLVLEAAMTAKTSAKLTNLSAKTKVCRPHAFHASFVIVSNRQSRGDGFHT